MANRKQQFFEIRTETGLPEGLYIAKTARQALDEHVKPLKAIEISPEQAMELIAGGMRAIVVGKQE